MPHGPPLFHHPNAWHDPVSLRTWAHSALHGLEHGLAAVAEGLDCGGGAGELLARDALGAPVVVVIACAADRTVAARVAAAHEFLARNPAVAARILPDSGFDPRLAPRILVLSAGIASHVLDALRRLAIDGLEVLEIEGFQLGDQPRVAVRRLLGSVLPEPAIAALGEALAAAWSALGAMLARIDPTLFVDGDRHARRLLVGGRALASYRIEGGAILAQVPGGAVHRIHDTEGAMGFVDTVLRRHASLLAGGSEVARAEAPGRAGAAPGPDVDAIREHLAAERLGAEG